MTNLAALTPVDAIMTTRAIRRFTDEPVSDEVIAKVRALPQVKRVNRLEF